MKNLRKILFFALFVGSLAIYMTSCDKSDPILENVTDVNFEKSDRENLVPEEEIDKFIVDWISKHRTAFDWDNAPDEMLYSALMYGNSILTISFKVGASTDKREFYRQNRRLPSDWINERESIIDFVLAEEKLYQDNERITVEDLLPFPLDDRLAVISIKVTNPSTISNLRSKYHVKLNPASYLPPSLTERRGPILTGSPSVGCHPDQVLINSNDIDTNIGINLPGISSYSSSSWNYDFHRIRDAWACTQGENIEVCIIDTGVSDNQPNLWQANFAPHGSGRTIVRDVTLQFLPGPCVYGVGAEEEVCPLYGENDECGHGTGMAGIIGAPSSPFSVTGIANKANLHVTKATHDVYLNALDELRGVRDAILAIRDRPQTRIVSMSLGSPSLDGQIADAITSVAMDPNLDLLMFAAAGTSTWLTNNLGSVIFPANHPDIYAVTGIDNLGFICEICHWGEEVQFAAIMEKDFGVIGEIGPVTLANTPGMKYTGGTSSATATVAGIAALIWSKYPDKSSDEIYDIMKQSSSNYDPNLPNEGHNNINGFGFIDVFDAVGECN